MKTQKVYDTASEAIYDLQQKGYTFDFTLWAEKECLICHKTGTELSPDEFDIDYFYRFEGNSDPGDSMIVYAISSASKNIKGIVVNAFGMYSDGLASSIVKKLNKHYTPG